VCNYSLSLFNENASALKPGGCGARQPRCRLTHAAKGCLSASRDAAVTADCLNRSFRAHSSSPQRGAGVEFHVSGRAIRRGDPARRIAPQLSMANEPDGNGLIEWHVRAVPDGRFSNHVYRTLKPRDILRIEGPFGTFVLRDTGAPIILLASGTGYAPIAAMLKTHAMELARRGAVLYWGGARLVDLCAYDEVYAWELAHLGFRFVPVLSENEPGWTGRKGGVHEAVAVDFPDLSHHEVYACGNPLMVGAARHTFIQINGLSATNFFSDAFVTRTST